MWSSVPGLRSGERQQSNVSCSMSSEAAEVCGQDLRFRSVKKENIYGKVSFQRLSRVNTRIFTETQTKEIVLNVGKLS